MEACLVPPRIVQPRCERVLLRDDEVNPPLALAMGRPLAKYSGEVPNSSGERKRRYDRPNRLGSSTQGWRADPNVGNEERIRRGSGHVQLMHARTRIHRG